PSRGTAANEAGERAGGDGIRGARAHFRLGLRIGGHHAACVHPDDARSGAVDPGSATWRLGAAIWSEAPARNPIGQHDPVTARVASACATAHFPDALIAGGTKAELAA